MDTQGETHPTVNDVGNLAAPHVRRTRSYYQGQLTTCTVRVSGGALLPPVSVTV